VLTHFVGTDSFSPRSCGPISFIINYCLELDVSKKIQWQKWYLFSFRSSRREIQTTVNHKKSKIQINSVNKNFMYSSRPPAWICCHINWTKEESDKVALEVYSALALRVWCGSIKIKIKRIWCDYLSLEWLWLSIYHFASTRFVLWFAYFCLA